MYFSASRSTEMTLPGFLETRLSKLQAQQRLGMSFCLELILPSAGWVWGCGPGPLSGRKLACEDRSWDVVFWPITSCPDVTSPNPNNISYARITFSSCLFFFSPRVSKDRKTEHCMSRDYVQSRQPDKHNQAPWPHSWFGVSWLNLHYPLDVNLMRA